jgi:nitroreductase
MELMDAIRGRRSIRRFTEQPVTNEEIRDILEAARQAPSWANTQAWEFVVVRDRAKIEAVTGTYAEKNPATKCSLAASVLIVGCARKGISGAGYSEEKKAAAGLNDWFMFDLGMAVQNLILCAHEKGLGTVVVGLMDHAACNRVLGLPAEVTSVVVVPVGRPAVAAKEGPPRKPLADISHLDSFDKRFIE